MKKGLKKGLSLLVTALMLSSIVPVSVMAEQTEIPGAAVVQTGNNNGNSQEEAIIFENGQAILVTNTKEAPPQNAVLNSVSQTDSIENEYQVTDVDGGVRITQYIGMSENIKIPATIADKTVLAIGDNAFYGNDSIESVVVSKSIVSIGASAFENCIKLKKIVIPSNVKIIGENAFNGSEQVTIFEFEGSEAEKYAQANGLTTSDVTRSNHTGFEYVDIEGGVKITKYTGIGGDVVVPATLNGKVVLEIGESAFRDNDSLTSITLPEGLKKIGSHAFFLCRSLTMVSFPESLEAIDGQAFGACDKLTSISLPQKVLFIDGNPFDQCDSLISFSVSPLNPNYQVINGLLVDKTGKTVIACPGGAASAIIPEGITAIGDAAFRGCRKITSLDLPENVVSIAFGAFMSTGLTSINLPKTVASIGRYAFTSCDNLTSITVSPGNSSFESIDGLFFDKDGTTLITCPAGKTSLVLPISVTDIGRSAFYGCDKLTAINLPENVKTIGSQAFAYCRNLTNLVLPEGTAEIDDSAFQGCTLLAKVVIPASVTKIGDRIFSDTPLGTIYGVYGSYAETYAGTNNIPFVGSGVPTATLQSIAITTAAAKWSYNIGDALDLTGLVVTGTYSDGTTKIETITAGNITGFDSSMAVGNQVLTITLNGKTATFTVLIVEAEDPVEGNFTAFLGQDPAGNYYEYNAADLSNAYLAYQIKPTLPSAKMYQQFLNSKCQIVALKDLTKGYMDYKAAATASLMAQMKGEDFDINAYFGSSNAKKFAETVENVKIVDQDGNIS